jgi:hypothetical protein
MLTDDLVMWVSHIDLEVLLAALRTMSKEFELRIKPAQYLQ